MQELTDSIRENEVLQPITVRPVGENKYKLVFGERRWRASNAVMDLFPTRNTIPAIIRELNDEEALEVQVVENIQRQDMNPMEEGVAFKQMHAKRSVEEVANRVGKPPVYVAKRMKLCDLAKEWQALLLADKMKLGLAFKLARLPENIQRVIYKEANVPSDWASSRDWELPDWVSVKDKEHPLDPAPFDIHDAGLYAEAGACTACQYNSQCNPLLFPELQSKPVCNNGVCYDIKSSRAYQQSIEQAMADPEMLFVSTQSYLYGADKKKVAAIEDMGLKVWGADMVELAEEPDPPPTWEGFLEEQKEDYEWDGMDLEEQQEYEQQWKDQHESLVTHYHEEVVEYREEEKAGLLKKAFVVVGHWKEGTITTVRLTGENGALPTDAVTGSHVELKNVQSEIDNIQKREKRNQELDCEKVYKKLIKLFKPENNPFLTNDEKLSTEECWAFLIALAEACHQVRNFLAAELNIQKAWSGLELFHAIQKVQSVGILQRSIRLFIYHKLVSESDADYSRNRSPAAFYEIGKQYFSQELAQMEKDQGITAAGRQKRVALRLKPLEVKKAALVAGDRDNKQENLEPALEMAEL